MSFFDRLQQLKYTSPAGQEFALDFDGTTQIKTKKYALNEYPQLDTADLQDLGNAATRYPVNCYIHGTDYDRTADRFAAALSERGAGTLSHPRWGTFQVLPISVRQEEQFVDSAGSARFEIEFVKYIPPKQQFAQQQAIAGQTAATAAASAQAGLSGVTLSAASVKILGARIRSLVSQVTTFADSITNFADDIKAEIDATANKILRGVNTLASAPVELARTMLDLYRLPLQISASAEDLVSGYKRLLTDIAAGFQAVSAEYGLVDATISTAAATAYAESLLAVDYDSRQTALTIVQDAAVASYNYQLAIGQYEQSSGFSLPVDLMSNVQATFTAAIDTVVAESISLPTEKIITTGADYSPLQLLHDLGGSVNDIEQFIEYNKLQGNNILLIPQGTEIRWYE